MFDSNNKILSDGGLESRENYKKDLRLMVESASKISYIQSQEAI